MMMIVWLLYLFGFVFCAGVLRAAFDRTSWIKILGVSLVWMIVVPIMVFGSPRIKE